MENEKKIQTKIKLINSTEEEIRQYVQDFAGSKNIRSKEKNRFGEVFTPIELIDEILDEIPIEIWRNPDSKWLDPAAGMGNFSALVYCRLLKTLESKIPDLEARKSHILQNMLFMVELNPKNGDYIRRTFGKECSGHIYQADFLSWVPEGGFDVIMGNPPFQTAKYSSYSGSAGGRTLWDRFLDKILGQNTTEGLIAPGGCLAFLTPASWRRPEAKLYPRMTRDPFHLLYLHIYGKADGRRFFGIQSRFDIYVLQKAEPKSSPKIVDELGEEHRDIDPRKWPFLPNFAFRTIKKILVSDTEGIDVLFSPGLYDARKLVKRKSHSKCKPIVHNITRRGLGMRWFCGNSDVGKNAPQHGPKVLLNFNEKQYPYNDYLGQYGMSQLTFGIPIRSKKEGEECIQALNSPAFTEILRATKWGSFQTDYRMFRYFSKDFYKNPLFA